jgi:hypothetical protein
MLLTSHLLSPDSPVRSYIRDAFPIIEQSKRGSLFAKEFCSLLNLDKLPPCCLPTLAPKAHQGTIGTAADYRLRYNFAPYDVHDTVAGHAVRMLGGSLGALGRKFLDYQDELVSRIKPAGRQLSEDDEATLDANCVILALFEQIYRIGDVYPPLSDLPRKAKLNDLLALAEPDVVKDIAQLSWAFAADAVELFKGKAILNPTFRGSLDVGGADADIIVNQTLIDFKCTSKIDATKLRAAALQLLGYVLLDYDDDYAIAELMVYLPRQRSAWRLPVSACVLSPSDLLQHLPKRATGDMDALAQQRLRERRYEFHKVVKSLG